MTLDDILKEVEPILRGKDVFQFAHPSFQEVLTAKYFSERISEGDSLALSVKIPRKILEFIAEMNPQRDLLYNFIYSTRKIAAEKCGLLGGNCATLLAMLGEDLRGKDFSKTNLNGADLSDQNLEGMILKKANIQKVSFDYSNLNGVDLRGAKYEGARFTAQWDDYRIAHFEGADKPIYFFNHNGSLIEWDLKHGEVRRMKFNSKPHYSKKLSFAPMQNWYIDVTEGIPTIFDVQSGKKIFVDWLSDQKAVETLAFSKNGMYMAIAQHKRPSPPHLTLINTISNKKFEIDPRMFGSCETVTDTYFSNDNRFFIYETLNNVQHTTKLFEVSDAGLKNIRNFSSDGLSRITNSVFSSDSRFLFAYGTVYGLEAKSESHLLDKKGRLRFRSLWGLRPKTLGDPYEFVRPLFFSHDNKYIVMYISPLEEEGSTEYERPRIIACDAKTGRGVDISYSFDAELPFLLSKDCRSVAYVSQVIKSTEGIRVETLDLKGRKLVPLYQIDSKSFTKLIK